MTENEAIQAIQNDLKWHNKELKPAYKECLKVAIKALEKQVPKKPIEIKCGCYGITKNGRKGYLIKNKCPNCGSEELMNSFPCSCGQKLDWK